MTRRLPKTIRFDASDTQVFDAAAPEGEWAVSGAFLFADAAEGDLTGKRRQAFANGFLGVASFGWSTFVAVAEIGDDEYATVVAGLADRFVRDFGAPSRAAAMAAAEEEVAFAAGLCGHKTNTLLAVTRDWSADGIVERFRVIEPDREPSHTRIWTIELDDEDGSRG